MTANGWGCDNLVWSIVFAKATVTHRSMEAIWLNQDNTILQNFTQNMEQRLHKTTIIVAKNHQKNARDPITEIKFDMYTIPHDQSHLTGTDLSS